MPSGYIPPSTQTTLLFFGWDGANSSFTMIISCWVSVSIVGILVLILVWRFWFWGFFFDQFEIDQAEIGVGRSKIRFRPTAVDRQIAYAIWVELSTRKIGLPIDFEQDVIIEVYNSWYTFFSVTRDKIKDVPVQRLRRNGTRAIVDLSIEVLNNGLRPHLTRWQARFRYWYDREIKLYDGKEDLIYPQDIQVRFPNYLELRNDMELVNSKLMRYRDKMQELALAR